MTRRTLRGQADVAARVGDQASRGNDARCVGVQILETLGFEKRASAALAGSPTTTRLPLESQ